jgi:hypothetical protein
MGYCPLVPLTLIVLALLRRRTLLDGRFGFKRPSSSCRIVSIDASLGPFSDSGVVAE